MTIQCVVSFDGRVGGGLQNRTSCTGGLFWAQVASTSAARQRRLGSSHCSSASRMGRPPMERRSLHRHNTEMGGQVAAGQHTGNSHLMEYSKLRNIKKIQ